MAKNQMSDAAKNALRNERRGLDRERQRKALAAREAAKALLDRKAPKPMPITPATVRSVDPRRNALRQAVVPRCSAVLASMGIKTRIMLDLDAPQTGAYTDMQDIFINMKLTDGQDSIDIVSTLRGAVYHESGHIRFSASMPEMMTAYRSHPNANRDIVGMWDTKPYALHSAWNALEDQRMETLVVDDSPRVARYFTPMVLDIVINERRRARTMEQAREDWQVLVQKARAEGLIDDDVPFSEEAWRKMQCAAYALVAQRRYLPRKVRRTLRREFVAVHGEQFTQAMERCVAKYVYSTDISVAVEAIAEFVPMMAVIMPSVDRHNPKTGRGKRFTPNPRQEPSDEAEDGDEATGSSDEAQVASDEQGDEDGGEQATDEQGDGDDGEGDGDEQGDGEVLVDGEGVGSMPTDSDDAQGQPIAADPSDVSHEDAGQGDGIGDHDGDHSIDEVLNEVLRDAISELHSDEQVINDARALNESMWVGSSSSTLERLDVTQTTDSLTVGRAKVLADNVVSEFAAVTMDALPTWQEQQRNGVLNVARYAARMSGDVEYWRSWQDEIQPARNIAVSVLLDYSGSMGGWTKDLSVAAYGMKAACDELEVPCTVVLWDHNARLLWDAGEKAEWVPDIRAAGGTDPRMALDDIPNQRCDRSKHLVLLMTDGEFDSRPNWLDQHRSEGCIFLGVRFSPLASEASRSNEAMSTMGFDRWMSTNHLEDMVKMLGAAIIDMSEV